MVKSTPIFYFMLMSFELHELAVSDKAPAPEVKRILDSEEYGQFLIDNGLNDEIKGNKAMLHEFLQGIGVNANPNFEFGKDKNGKV